MLFLILDTVGLTAALTISMVLTSIICDVLKTDTRYIRWYHRRQKKIEDFLMEEMEKENEEEA